MIDYDKEVVAALNQIGLKVYYEYFLDNKTAEIPCYSYYLYNNSVEKKVDYIDISKIIYHIKVWAKTAQDMNRYSQEADMKMRELGFRRTNCTEDWVDGIGYRDLKYQALGYEQYE